MAPALAAGNRGSLGKQVVFRGAQRVSDKTDDPRSCDGVVNRSVVGGYIKTLNERAVAGIKFSAENLQGDGARITGGTCSAMSFNFAKDYFSIVTQKTHQVGTKALAQLSEKYAGSSQAMRNLQMALNTIEVTDKITDHSKNKIQSLAKFFNFKIGSVSDEINMAPFCENPYDPNAEDPFAKINTIGIVSSVVEKLPLGVYLLRGIKSEFDIRKEALHKKMEAYGHSMIFIKERGGTGFFYDPNTGLDDLSGSGVSNTINEKLKYCRKEYQLDKARFYQLVPQQKKPSVEKLSKGRMLLYTIFTGGLYLLYLVFKNLYHAVTNR